jgi:hypothetical protein
MTAIRFSFPIDDCSEARPFFQAQGFVVLAAQLVTCRGVEFINYRMERVLAEPHPGAGDSSV